MVEDDERSRTAVRLALENDGWEVVEARSGEEALQVFPEADADIVLIDIMLPGIDGFEVEKEEFGNCFATDEFIEGTSAFLEKRKANF